MLNRARAAFRRDDGFALVDAIIGVTAMSAIVLTLVTTSVAASHTMNSAASQSERQMYLRSLVNELAPDPDAVQTTAQVSPVPFGDTTGTVSVVRIDDGASRSVIRAAVNATTSADCTAALAPAAGSTPDPTCLVTEVSVDRRVLGPAYKSLVTTITQRGVDTADGGNVVSGLIGTFTPETGTTAVKWVAGIRAGAAPARIAFYQSGALIGTQSFAAGTNTFLYGSVNVTSASPVTAQWAGDPGVVYSLLVYTVS